MGELLGGILISIYITDRRGRYLCYFDHFSQSFIILVTERSLLAPLGRHGKKAYQEVKRKHQETADSYTGRDARKEALALKQEKSRNFKGRCIFSK